MRQELDDIVDTERRALERHIAGVARDAATRIEQLRQMASDIAADARSSSTQLPEDVGGRIRGLSEYDFMDQDARQRFDELLDRLRQQVLDAQFAGLSDALQGMTQDDSTANREHGPRAQRPAPGAPRRQRAGRVRFPVALRQRLPGRARRSTTSSSSSPRGWPRCSR